MTSVNNLLHISPESSGMLIHAHIPAVPLILFLGIISVQDSSHSLLIPSVFHVYLHIFSRSDKHLLLKLHVMLFCWDRYQNLTSRAVAWELL